MDPGQPPAASPARLPAAHHTKYDRWSPAPEPPRLLNRLHQSLADDALACARYDAPSADHLPEFATTFDQQVLLEHLPRLPVYLRGSPHHRRRGLLCSCRTPRPAHLHGETGQPSQWRDQAVEGHWSFRLQDADSPDQFEIDGAGNWLVTKTTAGVFSAQVKRTRESRPPNGDRCAQYLDRADEGQSFYALGQWNKAPRQCGVHRRCLSPWRCGANRR